MAASTAEVPAQDGVDERSLLAASLASARRGAGAALLFMGIGLAIVIIGKKLQIFPLLGGTAVIIAGLICLVNTEWGIYVLLFFCSVDGFLKSAYASPVTIALKDVALMLCLLRWLGPVALGQRRGSFKGALTIPMLCFIVYVLGEMFNPLSPGVWAALAGARTWVIWPPLYLLLHDTLRDRSRFFALLGFILCLGVGVAAYGVVQKEYGYEHLRTIAPDAYNLHKRLGYNTAQGSEHRVFSTAVRAGALGQNMAMSALLAMALLSCCRTLTSRSVVSSGVLVMLVTLVFSGSRSAAFGLLLGLIVLAVSVRQPGILAATVLVVLMAWMLAMRATEGRAYYRFMEAIRNSRATIERVEGPWRRSLERASQHFFGVSPATGMGVGRMSAFVGRQRGGPTGIMVENEYGRAVTELGVPGFLLFMWLIVSAIRVAVRSVRASPNPSERWLRSCLLAAQSAMLVMLSAGPALYLAPGGPYFWVSLAMIERITTLPPGMVVQTARRRSRRSRDRSHRRDDVPLMETPAQQPPEPPRVIPRSPRALRAAAARDRQAELGSSE